MKRREFVRNVSLASIAVSAGTIHGLGAKAMGPSSFSLLDTFSLNGFDDELEELIVMHKNPVLERLRGLTNEISQRTIEKYGETL